MPKKITSFNFLNLLFFCSILFLSGSHLLMGQWNQTNGPQGGNTYDIVSVDNVLFVQAIPGGVFASLDEGITWSPANNGIPENEIVFRLTEDNGVLYAAVSRRGIYKSVDKGESWLPINNGIESGSFYSLRADGNQIYAGNANGGIYISSNGGDTWNYVGENIDGIQFNNFELFGTNVLASGASELYVSIDDGLSWESVEIQNFGPNGSRDVLAIDNSVFVATENHVFKSDDNLQTWQELDLDTNATILTLKTFENKIYATTSLGRYYVSENNGESWSLVQNTLTSSFISDIYVDGGKIITCTSEGLFSSDDLGVTWIATNDGLNAQSVQAIYVNQDNVFAGTNSNGLFKLNQTNGSWSTINNGLDGPNARSIFDIIENETGIHIATGDGVYFSSNGGESWQIKLDPPDVNQSISVLNEYNGTFLAGPGPNKNDLYISNDNLNTWSIIDIDILSSPTLFESLYFKENIIIVGTADGELFFSGDLGESWREISIDLGGFFFPYDIELVNDLLYVATVRGIVISENLGETWSFSKNFFTPTRDLLVHSDNIYAATSNGFYATNQNLDEWLPFNEGIGSKSQQTLFSTDEELFLGTLGSGVWQRNSDEISLPEPPLASEAFITTWKTDNPGVSADNQITIPTFSGEIYDYTVDWGDGTISENVTTDITHSYDNSGTYQISISGLFPAIVFGTFNGETRDNLKLLEVNQWGDQRWTYLAAAFNTCENLDVIADDIPDLSGVTDLGVMFNDCSSLIGNNRFAEWDTSFITNMQSLFTGCELFNQDISSWDVSNVERTVAMFARAKSFNQDIGNWDVSNVENMLAMFAATDSFNQSLNGWDTSDVTDMQLMFSGAKAFNQDLSLWNVSNVTNMIDMFNDSGLSNENYDKTLIGWNELSSLQNAVELGAPNNEYCLSEEARQNIIDTYSWIINDGGKALDCEEVITDNLPDENSNLALLPDAVLSGSVDGGRGDLNHILYDPSKDDYFISTSWNEYGVDFGENLGTPGADDGFEWRVDWPTSKAINYVTFGGTYVNQPQPNSLWRISYLTAGVWVTLEEGQGGWIDSGIYEWDNTSGSPITADALRVQVYSDGTNDLVSIHLRGRGGVSIRTNDSATATKATLIQYLPQEGIAPTADFDFTADEVDVDFDGSLSSDDIGIVDYSWDFGDGNTGNGATVSHTYAASGTYTVVLTVTDGDGLTDSISKEVEYDNGSDPAAFITTWKTDNPGVSEDNQITIPTFPGETYNYTVDWGDGSSEINVTSNITHTYSTPGIYQVSITGDFPRIYFNDIFFGSNDFIGDEGKILSIEQWGNIEWTSMEFAFSGCENLDVVSSDTPNLTQVDNMGHMFNNCSSLIGNTSFNSWDVSNVIDMRSLFELATLFNQDISIWDVGNVNNMNSMFSYASNFNQNIGSWDVSNNTRFQNMFARTNFNQNLGNWNMSAAVNIGNMFEEASSFNQDLGDWNISQVDNMNNIFNNSGLSNENYDKTLIGWNQLPSLQNGVELGAPNNEYCLSEEARQNIIDTYSWTINDGGKALDCDDAVADNLPDENSNLALLPDAVLSGSVDGGRGDLNHILYDPSKDDYFISTSWNEYGVDFGENLGTPGADDGFEWRVDWPTSKAINYVTFGGTYVNQPQPNSLWRISYLTAGVWVTLEEGQGGWIDSGIYEWDNTSGSPITADALRVQVYSDGTNDLVSIHLRGRGGVSIRTNDSATATKATLIQYLPQEASNAADNILPSIEQPTPNNLNLYPNPATDNVVMSFDIPAKVVEFRVFDLLGRLVRVQKVDTSNNEYELPVFDLQAGTYFVRTVDEKGNEFQKQMVIKR